MFHNNKKTDAVAEAVKKILEVSESVESVEEDMHKPLLPKQKEVQKKVDAETKRQNPPKKQAGTIAASVGAMRKEEKSFKDRLIETFKQKEKPEELLPDLEEEMSDAQKKKREEIVMSMKDKTSYFKKKYGARWKNVMYATATKQAMGEQIVYDDYIYDSVVEATHDDEEEDEKQMKAHNADPDSHKPAIKKMVKKDCLKSEEIEQIEEEEARRPTDAEYEHAKKQVQKTFGNDRRIHAIGVIGDRIHLKHGTKNATDMKGVSMRLPEEVDRYDEEEHAGHLGHAARQAAKSGKKMFTLGGKTFPVKVKAVKENNESHTHAAHYEDSKTGEWSGMKLMVAKDDKDAIEQAHKNCEDGCRLSKVERHIPVKEEAEQIEELKKSTLRSYAAKRGSQPDKGKNGANIALALTKAKGKPPFPGMKDAKVYATKEEVELDEGYSAHTHTVHFSDPESGEWKGKMLIVADNDNEAVDLAHHMAKDNDLKVMKVSKNHLVMMDRTMGEEIENEEEIIFEASEQNIDDEDITTDMLRGRVAGGKVNSFKNFKLKLKSDREYQRPPSEKDSVPAATAARASVQAKKWDPPSNVKTEEVELVDEGSPEFNARALRYAKADAAEKDREGRYSKKYPGGKEQHAKDTAAFMKRFPPPKNEEVEQIDEKKGKMILVVPKKPDSKGMKPVKRIHSHEWPRYQSTHYQAEEVELGEGKDPSMDAGVGSEPSFVQNANPSSNPSPKHTPMSKAKELASKTITKIKADLGRR